MLYNFHMKANVADVHQMLLPFESEQRIKNIFEKVTGFRVDLIITKNVYSLLTVKKKRECYIVRLSNIFLNADDSIIKDLALFVLNKRRVSENVKFFLKKQAVTNNKRDRNITLNHTGKEFDLLEIYNRLNNEYFNNSLNVRITWGRSYQRRRVKTRQLGNYNEKQKLIRISPVLDNKVVPMYYLEFIVYHEMLHAYLGVKKINGRRSVHNKEFKEKERHFKFYNEAITWEKANIL